MKNLMKITMAAFALSTAFAALPVRAEETLGEKVEEGASDTGKAIKKSARNVKDKTCEMVNGKLECAGKKLKHRAKNAADEINDKAEDITH